MSARHPVSDTPQTAPWRLQARAIEQQMRSWWSVRSAQEQRLLQVCCAVIAVALIWAVGMQPALTSIQKSRSQLPQLHTDAAQVQAYILEAQALQRRHAGSIDATQLTQALQNSLLRTGLNDATTLQEVDNAGATTRQWEVTLFNASAALVMEWLSEMPYQLRLHTPAIMLERASVDGRDRPGYVSGRVLVSQPEKDQP
ncbi:type II secretion system protein M [Alcaligenaceae bacterium]|nr:type II secretion system protein M [Alcaligenaceae bacterium]